MTAKRVLNSLKDVLKEKACEAVILRNEYWEACWAFNNGGLSSSMLQKPEFMVFVKFPSQWYRTWVKLRSLLNKVFLNWFFFFWLNNESFSAIGVYKSKSDFLYFLYNSFWALLQIETWLNSSSEGRCQLQRKMLHLHTVYPYSSHPPQMTHILPCSHKITWT